MNRPGSGSVFKPSHYSDRPLLTSRSQRAEYENEMMRKGRPPRNADYRVDELPTFTMRMQRTELDRLHGAALATGTPAYILLARGFELLWREELSPTERHQAKAVALELESRRRRLVARRKT